MTVLDGLDPTWVYAVKGNIKFPGTQAQATAGEAFAATRATTAYGQTVSVAAGSIQVANP
jgi:hypothetical protein